MKTRPISPVGFGFNKEFNVQSMLTKFAVSYFLVNVDVPPA